ncbi:MAG: hypothetical protein CMP23_17755 [Rickettsiales bacterium]|nr:hypothetical protein [Rickettsiales bacterium]|tara:strand:+ start:1957 stop:2709 length:753 start_codon:yes stop_codon:yes gene_type:complete
MNLKGPLLRWFRSVIFIVPALATSMIGLSCHGDDDDGPCVSADEARMDCLVDYHCDNVDEGTGLCGADGFCELALPTCVDADGDGFDSSEDCDDNNPAVHPGAPEVADDGVDQDCNGDDNCCATGPVGLPPVIEGVDLCEVPNSSDQCQAQGFSPGSFQIQFALTLSDVDGDLNNPSYFLIVNQPPAMSGFVEQDLGTGGVLRVLVCNDWVRSTSIDYELWVRDAELNESERLTGSWLIPEPGVDQCEQP